MTTAGAVQLPGDLAYEEVRHNDGGGDQQVSHSGLLQWLNGVLSEGAHFPAAEQQKGISAASAGRGMLEHTNGAALSAGQNQVAVVEVVRADVGRVRAGRAGHPRGHHRDHAASGEVGRTGLKVASEAATGEPANQLRDVAARFCVERQNDAARLVELDAPSAIQSWVGLPAGQRKGQGQQGALHASKVSFADMSGKMGKCSGEGRRLDAPGQ